MKPVLSIFLLGLFLEWASSTDFIFESLSQFSYPLFILTISCAYGSAAVISILYASNQDTSMTLPQSITFTLLVLCALMSCGLVPSQYMSFLSVHKSVGSSIEYLVLGKVYDIAEALAIILLIIEIYTTGITQSIKNCKNEVVNILRKTHLL